MVIRTDQAWKFRSGVSEKVQAENDHRHLHATATAAADADDDDDDDDDVKENDTQDDKQDERTG